MKINWGTGIAIFYIFFVLSLVYQVIRAGQYDHSLVVEEYYKEDLAYQKHYDKLLNNQQLNESLIISRNTQTGLVELQFPQELEAVNGRIHFYCPSDSKSDFSLPVVTDETLIQRVPVEGLRKGKWKVKVDFSDGEKAYYKEEAIEI